MNDPVAGDSLDISARVPIGRPVIHLDASPPLEVGSHWQKADELRETARLFETHAQGTGSSRGTTRCARVPAPGDLLERGHHPVGPEPAYRSSRPIDPPEHSKYRQ